MNTNTDLRSSPTEQEFIDWLEYQPSDDPINFDSNSDCVIARFLKDRGHTGVFVGGYGNFKSKELNEGVDDRGFFLFNTSGPLSRVSSIAPHHRTYGELLDALQASRVLRTDALQAFFRSWFRDEENP